MSNPKLLTQDSINFLNRELKLPISGQEQDWEIELSDASRVGEFISFYEKEILNNECKSALAALILSSFEDLTQIRGVDRLLWERISNLLLAELELHKEIINYWALWNDEDVGIFLITNLMRSLKITNNE